MVSKAKQQEIRKFIIQNVQQHPQEITSLTAATFSITRQAALRYIHDLVGSGVLIAKGLTRSRKYSLAEIAKHSFVLPVVSTLQEDAVWRDQVKSLFDGVPQNIKDICYHGFTEMFNNVIDHSGAASVTVELARTAASISLWIVDDGVGIFRKIAQSLNLADDRESLLELSKGKLTTDPDKHTGEGIFFTSRIFDSFCILSGDLGFLHREATDDWLLEDKEKEQKGTAILMEISSFSDRIMNAVFERYATEEHGFSRTHVPVALAIYGDENLISRSQAKRVLARVNRFREILLDFANVEMVGQAFADEIFRVFAREHSDIRLRWINANEQIEGMISRARLLLRQEQEQASGPAKDSPPQLTMTTGRTLQEDITGNAGYPVNPQSPAPRSSNQPD